MSKRITVTARDDDEAKVIKELVAQLRENPRSEYQGRFYYKLEPTLVFMSTAPVWPSCPRDQVIAHAKAVSEDKATESPLVERSQYQLVKDGWENERKRTRDLSLQLSKLTFGRIYLLPGAELEEGLQALFAAQPQLLKQDRRGKYIDLTPSEFRPPWDKGFDVVSFINNVTLTNAEKLKSTRKLFVMAFASLWKRLRTLGVSDGLGD
jgi:hypothetical protein